MIPGKHLYGKSGLSKILLLVLLLIESIGCNQSPAVNRAANSKTYTLEQLQSDDKISLSDEQIDQLLRTHFPRVSISRAPQGYESLHSFAANAIPEALAIERQYRGSVDHFITGFGLKSKKKNIWNTVAFFGNRYTLSMQVEIEIDYGKKAFRVLAEPQFYLHECNKIRRNGQASFGNEFRFSKNEFEQLTSSNWDYSQIGININSTPVRYFAIYELMWRSPRYPISLTSKE